MDKPGTDWREALIRHYFDMCNKADHAGLVACFTPDAVHYFPPGLPGAPWRGAGRIAEGWVWCVETLGSQWTIERILLAEGGAPEAVIEWTHWKAKQATALRGDEWYRFDPDTRLISEIRAYYASATTPGLPINELHDFDYAGRGYALEAGSPKG